MNNLDSIKGYNLDWNPMTADGYSHEKNEAILVFNFDITSPDKIINVIQYSVGRAIWCCKNFPAEVKIKMAFDFRGQGIIVSKTRSLKNKIIEIIEKLKITNQISIEFLI